MELDIKTKTFKLPRFFTKILPLGLLALGVLSASSVAADTLVRGYSSKITLEPGIVVALGSNPNEVIIAPAGDLKKMYGVVIDPTESPVSLSSDTQKTFVATSGKHGVLVTNQKGSIKTGDFVSLSLVDGIAAKATKDQGFILGRALEPFDGKNKVISTVAGVTVGRITVDVSPRGNPLQKSSAAIPEPLKRVSESIAGNPVGTVKIYIALVVLLASATIAGILITVGVRSGIVSIGRNPLSRKSIMRGLTQAVLMAILIFIVGLLGVYLLLKL